MLLERAAFLQSLADYADDAAHGNGRIVLVSGESGMGKTALVEGFQQQLTTARWLWGACDGLLTPRPLGPLFDIAAQAGGGLADWCRRSASRDQLFAAFVAELDSSATLTVAVIEDVHWADEATIDLLSFAGRRLGRVRALLLVTYRDDELRADHPLRIVLGDLATQGATRRIGLPPLSEQAVRLLVGQRSMDAAEVHRVTGGNPFYVNEIVTAGWPTMPPNVREAVGARLGRLGAGARSAVEIAAVIGSRLDRLLLTSVLAGSASSLDECLAAGIFIADGKSLRFRHELVRMAVDAAVAPYRKQELHARLLAAIAEAVEADPVVLAHHADGAADGNAVLRYAPQAARRSSTLGAHRESAVQFERALRFAAHGTTAVIAELNEGLAREYSLLDRWNEAEHALRLALDLRRQLRDDLAVGENLRVLSQILWRLCRGTESRQAAMECVDVLESLPPGRELAWAYANVGSLHMLAGRGYDALSAGEKALALGKSLSQADVVSHALNTIGSARLTLGEDGFACVEQALRVALDADLQEAVGYSYTVIHEIVARLHRFADEDRYFKEGMAYCDGRELGVYSTCLNGWRAYTLMQLGHWDDAVGVARQMLGRQAISPVNRINPLRVLGTILGRRGEPEAWKPLDEALDLAEGTLEAHWIVAVREHRAELRWIEGRPGEALAEVQSAYEHLAGNDRRTQGSLVHWLARLGAAVVAPDGLPKPFAQEIAGDWQGAAATWTRRGRPYDAAIALLASSDEAELRMALATFDDMGACVAAAAARRRMKHLGMTAIPRGPRAATRAAPSGLTTRQQQVLALVSDGLSDKEIARRLFISERTVHHHVAAVLSKMGVPSRTAAAREAARMGLVTEA
jgi:DNA-binding CsgD family transcriptional regulator/tetratricopeptide (TPR) repeat protein